MNQEQSIRNNAVAGRGQIRVRFDQLKRSRQLSPIGLPELITDNLADYEARALELATSPALLAATCQKLRAGRLSAPLFDTDRFRRHIEAAYLTMYERHLAGEAPQGFDVTPVD